MDIFRRRQFLQFAKKNKWNHYCEIIITRGGRIILAAPSHQYCLLRYLYEKEHVDSKLYDINSKWYENNISTRLSPTHLIVDKYGLICVWYEYIIYSKEKGISKAQMDTLNILRNNKLLSDDCIKEPTLEYTHHLIDIGKRTYDDLNNLADIPYDRYLFKKNEG